MVPFQFKLAVHTLTRNFTLKTGHFPTLRGSENHLQIPLARDLASHRNEQKNVDFLWASGAKKLCWRAQTFSKVRGNFIFDEAVGRAVRRAGVKARRQRRKSLTRFSSSVTGGGGQLGALTAWAADVLASPVCFAERGGKFTSGRAGPLVSRPVSRTNFAASKKFSRRAGRDQGGGEGVSPNSSEGEPKPGTERGKRKFVRENK